MKADTAKKAALAHFDDVERIGESLVALANLLTLAEGVELKRGTMTGLAYLIGNVGSDLMTTAYMGEETLADLGMAVKHV
jgi:hypothetical protein